MGNVDSAPYPSPKEPKPSKSTKSSSTEATTDN